jgi:hypothetical protein
MSPRIRKPSEARIYYGRVNPRFVEAGPIKRDKMTTEANLPALFCFGSAFVFFWAWWKLTIAEHEDREDDQSKEE